MKMPKFFQKEKDITVASGDKIGAQIQQKGIWTRFIHTC